MSEIKAILLCGSNIAIPVLRDMLFHQQVAAVVIPQHCTGFIAQVQQLLKDSGIPVALANRQNIADVLQETIEKYRPAMGLVFTFSFKIPIEVYSLPPHGFFNVHPGPLPAYRGPDPIFRQIQNKEPYAGISIHKLDEGLDTGPLVLSDKIWLSSTDTYGILSKKLGELASVMTGTLIKMAGFGTKIPSREQDHTKANFYQRQLATDITINWQTMDAASIIALINACNPWNKGAVTVLNNNVIRLLQACTEEAYLFANEEPGSIISFDENGMKVVTAKGQAITVKMIYSDEGFLPAGRLQDFGVRPGARLGAA